MSVFDTKVQSLKYKVLREVARYAFEDRLIDCYKDIPTKIVPGPKATMRCCTYKEKAIVSERISIALGGDKTNPNVIEVIEIACDECPVGGFEISGACRGCIAHRCEDACPVNAITFDNKQKAHIDKDLCIECGKCADVCPYNAIMCYSRPCESACKTGAISMSDDKSAKIDDDKCSACGACVYQCPFGAIVDKSFIVDAIDLIKKSENNEAYKLYAIVAPSISGQFTYAKLGQVVTAIKELGFYTVVEAALGADLVAYDEARELAKKGYLTSSCCPAFVSYLKKNHPNLEKFVSKGLSPMARIAKYIKETEENVKVVFIGPCTAKKMEFQDEEVSKYVDCVLTFEELQALIDSRDIDLASLDEGLLDNASFYGRIFARSGGLSDAIRQALKEQNIEFDFNPIVCDGIEECMKALKRADKNRLENNFIEGMVCTGGCIGGAGCLTHGPKSKSGVDLYGKEAYEKTISSAISFM